MIRRVNDDVLTERQLQKIAQTVSKRENEKFFDLVNENEVNLIKKQLQIQGFKVRVEPFKDMYKIYAIAPEKVKFEEAMNCGAFKKLAWGRYCFQHSGALNLFKYDFDDGSIWRVEKDAATGEEYLIKEISDEDEENIIRMTKTASLQNDSIIDDSTIKIAASILFESVLNSDSGNDLLNLFIESIQTTAESKNKAYSLIESKLMNICNQKTNESQFLQQPEYIADLKSIIKTAMLNKELKSEEQLKNLIGSYEQQIIKTIGKIGKLFD